MSFFGGGTDQMPEMPKQLLGMDEKQWASTEQALPVPWFAGRARLAVTWLGQAFNVLPVAIEGGEKKEPAGMRGYKYYAGCAGLVCAGPVDRIMSVYMDDEKVWPLTGQSLISRGTEDYVDIAITGRGTMRLYWGTETQTIDSVLATLTATGTANPTENHPAYRGLCYVRFASLYFGKAQLNAPNVELEVGRYPSVDGFLWESEVTGDASGAVAALDLALSSRYGLGISTDRIDMDAFNTAGECYSGECHGVSPVLTGRMTYREFLATLGEYLYSYTRSTDEGKLSLEVIRGGSTAGLPVLDEDDMITLPRIRCGGWEGTDNEVSVKFTNAANHYKEAVATVYDLANLSQTGGPRATVLKRRWTTRQRAAQLQAAVNAQIRALPSLEGTLRVKSTSLGDLRPGSLFKLNYAHLQVYWVVCRVRRVRWTSAEQPEVELEFSQERPELSGAFVQPAIEDAPSQVEVDLDQIADALVLEAPYDHRSKETPIALFLAKRPNGVATKYAVWRQLSGSDYEWLFDVSHWAWHGTLDSQLNAGATSVSLTLDGPDLVLPTGGITAEEGAQNKYLLLVGDEIMSVHTPVAGGSGQYDLTCIRERFDTKDEQHSASAECWIIPQANARVTAFDATDQDHDDTDVQTFKLQPMVGGNPLAMSEVTNTFAVTWSDRVRRFWKPRDLDSNGVGRSSGEYQSGDDIEVSWTRVNRDGGETWDEPSFLIKVWRLELWQGGVKKGDWEFAANDYQATIPKTTVTGGLTGWEDYMPTPSTFVWRLYAQRDYRGSILDSREYEDFTMTLV